MIRLKDRELPVKVGHAVMESVNENFRKGGFYGRGWKATRRQQLGFRGVSGRYGPLLSKNNNLSRSTVSIPGQGRVTIQNNAEYAEIHNEGGEIPVTANMKRFFWAKYYETGPIKPGTGDRKKSSSDTEAGFWRGMALKRTGSTIKIPKRQSIGPSPQVSPMSRHNISESFRREIQSWKESPAASESWQSTACPVTVNLKMFDAPSIKLR